MRGGTANCTVKFGPEMIYCPAQEEPDVVLAMNAPSLKKFATIIAPNGVLVYNSDMIDEADLAGVRSDIRVIAVPCLRLADKVKNPKGANIVMIGVIMKLLGEFGHDNCVDGMNDMFQKKGKAKYCAENTAAFNEGYDFV
jgi:2-oxoglutarate ferredoxin oxidoreductase subunit gamma